MSTGLLFDCDDRVAEFLFSRYFYQPMKFDKAIGIITNGDLIGGILFQGYNGHNVELSYYGKNTLTPGIVRCIARYVINTFNVSRVTVNTSKRNKQLIKSLVKLGFAVEGRQNRFYGQRDCNRNVAIRFVMFREQVETLARFEEKAVS